MELNELATNGHACISPYLLLPDSTGKIPHLKLDPGLGRCSALSRRAYLLWMMSHDGTKAYPHKNDPSFFSPDCGAAHAPRGFSIVLFPSAGKESQTCIARTGLLMQMAGKTARWNWAASLAV